MTNRKGIILAGGTGSRLFPMTEALSKQLLPVYDKPMIYYAISTLMLSGIQDIAIITNPHDQNQFKRLLKDGSQWGLNFAYIEQTKPEGIAQAYLLAEDFLGGAPSALVLGDNLFFGADLTAKIKAACLSDRSTIFGYSVRDPHRYGVIKFNKSLQPVEIIEKPSKPPSPYAVTGLYFLDSEATRFAKQVKPSARGELEITDLLMIYMENKKLDVELLGRGFAWLDTGTSDSLLDAGNFIRTLGKRQSLQAGCLEEIAFEQGWISAKALRQLALRYGKNEYGKYLISRLDTRYEFDHPRTEKLLS